MASLFHIFLSCGDIKVEERRKEWNEKRKFKKMNINFCFIAPRLCINFYLFQRKKGKKKIGRIDKERVNNA